LSNLQLSIHERFKTYNQSNVIYSQSWRHPALIDGNAWIQIADTHFQNGAESASRSPLHLTMAITLIVSNNDEITQYLSDLPDEELLTLR
jgi:hypothetical protein